MHIVFGGEADSAFGCEKGRIFGQPSVSWSTSPSEKTRMLFWSHTRNDVLRTERVISGPVALSSLEVLRQN